MKKNKKIHQIHLLLSDRELEMFKDKAKNYDKMSAMIRDAVSQFNDQGTMLRLDSLNALFNLMKTFQYELSREGGNLNQVVKRANELIYSGELSQSYFDKVLLPAISDVQKLIFEIKKQQTVIFKNLMKI